jgi:hypothetical protein
MRQPFWCVQPTSQYALGVVRLTLPVAHQHASLASSTTMLFPFALPSSERYLATEVPVMPVPTTTMSALAGKSSVVRCPSKNSFGSLCQNEFEDVGVGREARGCFMVCIVGSERGGCGVDWGGPSCLYRYRCYRLRRLDAV